MNNFIIAFVFIVLTARFFTETLGVAPKAVDLLDLAIIPVLFLLSAASRPRDVDQNLHRKILHPTVGFFLLCILSAAINFERVSFGPLVLFIFGMLEGPIFFLSLNKLIHNKKQFGEQVLKFINMMMVVEILVVIFVSYPLLIATGNPDKMSGTFGNNSYQFTVLLIIIGGYLIGKQYTSPRSMYYAIAIQFFIILTFLLLQYRTAVPAFFLSYAILISILYGKRFLRLAVVAIPIALIIFFGFRFVNRSNLDLKYEDLLVLTEDASIIFEHGKFHAYLNTFAMFSEYPTAIPFGCGPGTYVSRANYTFTTEIKGSQDKGVGSIITRIFGDKDYATDVYETYIEPLGTYEALFGSVQINNPNSSVLALLAEVGIVGLFLMGMIYVTLITKSLSYFRYAVAKRDPLLLPLASALTIGAVYLSLIAPLDNYLEIARVTIPVWFLFWTVSTMVHRDRLEYQALLYYKAQEEAATQQITSGGVEDSEGSRG